MGDLFRSVFEHAANGLVILDFEGRILDFNPAASRMLGPSRGAVFQRPFDSFLNPQAAADFTEKLGQLEELGHLSLQASLPGPEGRQRDLLMDLSLVPWEDDAQAALLTLRELAGTEGIDRYLLLHEQALHGSGFTRSMYVLSREAPAEPFRGPDASSPEEETRRRLQHPAWIALLLDGERLRAHVDKAWSGGRVELAPAWYGADDLDKEALSALDESLPLDRYLGIELVPLRDEDDDVDRVLAAVEDVTLAALDLNRKRRKDQRTALSLFAGVLVHELNTYLGVILAQASALRLDTPAGNLAPPAVGAILDAGQNAANLLRRANEIGNELGMASEEVDFNAVVLEAVRILRHLLENRVTIRVDTAAGLSKVRGDADLLRTMVIALGQCAEASMPAGEELVIETLSLDPLGPAAPPGVGLNMSCSDVEPEAVAGPRSSLESLLSRPTKGAGDPLNFAFAQAVARKHRGQLKLEEDPESGNVWNVTLPGEETRPRLTGPLPAGEALFDEAAMEEQIARTAEGAKEGSSTSTDAVPDDDADEADAGPRFQTRILLVDDEENFRDFARDVLQENGYEVDVAEDGQEGFERFREDPDRYALVILDAYMPRLGGLETSLRMQVIRPDLLVLFVSGFVRGPSLEAMLTGCPGPAEVILKPFTGEELVAAVKKLLGMVEARE